MRILSKVARKLKLYKPLAFFIRMLPNPKIMEGNEAYAILNAVNPNIGLSCYINRNISWGGENMI